MTTPSTPTPSPFALVLRHVDQGVVNVEGQSPDGWIAIHVAHLHSELVRRLVAIQPDQDLWDGTARVGFARRSEGEVPRLRHGSFSRDRPRLPLDHAAG